MTHLRHWLIAAALLSATRASGLDAQPLEGVHAAVTGEITEQAVLFVQPHLQREAVLAAYSAQPLNRMEIGIGLGHDALANGGMGWYGVYLQSLDRVAERNTIYGLLRETPRPGRNDGEATTEFCCQRGNTVTSLEQFATTIAAHQVSPTFYLFGMLRKKGWNLNIADGWKLQAGVRHLQYSSAPRTKVGFLTVERSWEGLRTSYSYQLERSGGWGIAPSHVLQLDYFYSPRNLIGVSLASGREFADFGPLGMLNTEVRSVAARGQHWFKHDWALTFQAGYNDHGSMPTKKGVRFGVRHSF